VRAALLKKMSEILPGKLSRIFFANSGAEANDAVIKLARKISGRLDVISMTQSFHGRTISTASATGQAKHREKYNPLMPNYRFVPFNDIEAMRQTIDANVAAVLLEPVQGEGGVILPKEGYLESVSALCKEHGVYLIVDEVQTGFCRTGPMFAINRHDLSADFLTMAKGIGGGFPFAAFAVTEAVAAKVEIGDHGGTYCGNPLGCAAALAVVQYLIDHDIETNVEAVGKYVIDRMRTLWKKYPEMIADVRGVGLLVAVEFMDTEISQRIYEACLKAGLFINVTQGKIFRIFPALTITHAEAGEGLAIFESVVEALLG
jgi:acetylornithine/N-succinyldiaminopimelate aminotransferase